MLLALLATMLVLVASDPTQAQGSMFGAPRPAASASLFSGITAWIFAQQAAFYRSLSGLIRASSDNSSAMWSLFGVSFLYGIFHAAGPGHGKAVISSYLVANEETWRRGVILSFAAAVLQSIVAVLVVAVAVMLLGATAKSIGLTVRAVEIVCYGSIVLIGLRLLWVKGRSFVLAWRQFKPSMATSEVQLAAAPAAALKFGLALNTAAFHCKQCEANSFQCDGGDSHDHHASAWSHAHGPEPAELAGDGGWRRGFSAVVAVGLRPCSGAIIVLIFALTQDLFWTGVGATLLMGLGTALTVAGIASLAVGARRVARRLADTRPGEGALLMRAIEVGASGLIVAFGALLLTGYLASEQLWMFTR